jgi:hypothetical protein
VINSYEVSRKDKIIQQVLGKMRRGVGRKRNNLITTNLVKRGAVVTVHPYPQPDNQVIKPCGNTFTGSRR